MKWTEITEGHLVCQNGCHVVDGTLRDPCQKCKGTGKRGRGRCGDCMGEGNRRRSYDTGAWITLSSSCRVNLATVKAIQELRGVPNTVYQFDHDDDRVIDESYYRQHTG